MFRRLAEGFSSLDDFAQSQQSRFNAYPNMIPSATSGLKGFDNAIRTSNTYGTDYQEYPIRNPNDIFVQTKSSALRTSASACNSTDIDELIRQKDPSAQIGCGWMYTPPNKNSPYPLASRGALGDANGPYPIDDLPAHKKWFFDLQEAKKTMLLDKCKALKACTDLDSAVFNGICGFCTDTNQGVPIDAVGKPLYNDPRATCSDGALVTSKGSCPQPSVDGPRPMIDRTCEPVNGRLSLDCLHQTVLSGGCSDKGALAIALGSQGSITRLSTGDSVSIYNRVANPPLTIGLFTGGNTTVNTVLQEVRQLTANTSNAANTALGAAARDLCLKQGAINGYNRCAELSDASSGPYDMNCLQLFFLTVGGSQRGSAYPSPATMSTYNTMSSIGAIKQYWQGLLGKMKGRDGFVDYATQKDALKQMLGIVPEEMIVRAPYKQGVEVFWFVPSVMNPSRVNGFLRRTIEPTIVQFQAGPSNVPQIGGLAYGCMLQLTDLRAPADFSTRFEVNVDDGFWIAVNQPAAIDEKAMAQAFQTVDVPGFFENLGLQGPTTYQSRSCTAFHSATPNIMKLFHEDAGGGWASFKFKAIGCEGKPVLEDSMYLSLTCEARAPFLQFEVSPRSKFEELRNPGVFNQFITSWGTDMHTRTDEQTNVPGKKSFVRINSASSMINLENIAYQSWKTMTAAMRFQSMPVKETIIALACGPAGSWFCNLIATPINGSTAGIQIEYKIADGPFQYRPTSFQIALNAWYLFRVDNIGTGFVIYCDSISNITTNKGSYGYNLAISGSKQLWDANATWSPTPGQVSQACNIMFGTDKYRQKGWAAMYGSGAFTYDIAWVHFFDGAVNDNDLYRDVMSNWIYTQFPSNNSTYS
jgi:hypothetical protein